MSKINHDYKCQNCGEIATINCQEWTHIYSIDKDGIFNEIRDFAGDQNEFFCDKCAKKDYLIN